MPASLWHAHRVAVEPTATWADEAEAQFRAAYDAPRGLGLRRVLPVLVLVAGVLVVRSIGTPAVSGRAATWLTIFVAITLQAMPFLVFGVALSGAVAALMPDGALRRIFPQRTAFAVPIAGMAGALLPGCECGSVPLARQMVVRGVSPSAALTFLLSAPAINPVVTVATAVAFAGQPMMAVARVVASLLAAIVVGFIWYRKNWDEFIDPRASHGHEGPNRWQTFRLTVRHDVLHAGGYLALGAGAAATLRAVVPASVLERVGGAGWSAVLAMAVLAVVLSICSEADAFVAVGLTQFSLTSRLVFLVVGPMVDLKLIALQWATFGRAFVVRFAPLTLAVATGSALIVGRVLL